MDDKVDSRAVFVELERRRLKAQTYKAIQDAKENYQDIDPSKYKV